MQEFDLQSIWEENKREADAYYDKVRTEVLQLAQERSQSILQALKRQAWQHFGFSSLLFLIIIVLMWSVSPILLVGMIVLTIINTYVAWQHYRRFLWKMDLLSTDNTKQYIQHFIELLLEYKQVNWRNLLIWGPIGMLIGFLGGMSIGSNNDLSYLLDYRIFLIGLIGLLSLHFIAKVMNKKYYSWVFDRKIEELETLLKSIEE